jgi:nucleotide-binding universal stress UspA family protein
VKVDTILVPTDFSADAEKALSTATDLAKVFGAKLVVLHAYHVDIPMAGPMGQQYSLPQGFYDEVRSQATEQVEKLAVQVAASGIEANGVAVFEPASLSIVNHAESIPADLIVMGTRGRTGLKHVVLGSVAERVVRTAPCPVLTVKTDS